MPKNNKKGEKKIRIKLIDKYGFSKIISISKKAEVVAYPCAYDPHLTFRLRDISEKELPIYYQE